MSDMQVTVLYFLTMLFFMGLITSFIAAVMLLEVYIRKGVEYYVQRKSK